MVTVSTSSALDPKIAYRHADYNTIRRQMTRYGHLHRKRIRVLEWLRIDHASKPKGADSCELISCCSLSNVYVLIWTEADACIMLSYMMLTQKVNKSVTPKTKRFNPRQHFTKLKHGRTRENNPIAQHMVSVMSLLYAQNKSAREITAIAISAYTPPLNPSRDASNSFVT